MDSVMWFPIRDERLKLSVGLTTKTTQYQMQKKKSELMLMRGARAYSSSCLHVGLILVYLHPIRRNSLFSSQKLPKSTKTPIFGTQGHGHQC